MKQLFYEETKETFKNIGTCSSLRRQRTQDTVIMLLTVQYVIL